MDDIVKGGIGGLVLLEGGSVEQGAVGHVGDVQDLIIAISDGGCFELVDWGVHGDVGDHIAGIGVAFIDRNILVCGRVLSKGVEGVVVVKGVHVPK